MMLCVGLGKSEMSLWLDWWQEELEGVDAQARSHRRE